MLHGALIRHVEYVLASTSPRRVSILKKIPRIRFRCEAPRFTENLAADDFGTPREYAIRNAECKAYAVYSTHQHKIVGNNMCDDRERPHVVSIIGADTILVRKNGVVLEKPGSRDAATKMLTDLSGETCLCVTGVCTIVTSSREKSTSSEFKSFADVTRITFAELDRSTIDAYVATGEPLDKAGSIGYQDFGASLISGIEGCFFNVVGFPLHRFCREIKPMLRRHLGGDDDEDDVPRIDIDELQHRLSRHFPSNKTER